MNSKLRVSVICLSVGISVSACGLSDTAPDFGGHGVPDSGGDVLLDAVIEDTTDVIIDDAAETGMLDDVWIPENALSWERNCGQNFFSYVAVLHNPYAGLSAVLTFETAEPAISSVLVEADGAEPWVVSSGETEPVTEHTVYVMGLHVETSYRMRVQALHGEVNKLCDKELVYTTDPLPEDFPEFSTVVSRPDLMQPGYTVFALHKLDLNQIGKPPRDFFPRLITVDDTGRVVGYTKWSDPDATLQGFTRLGNGNYVILNSYGFILMDAKGEIVEKISLSELGLDREGVADDSFLHHDAISLPDGRFAAIATSLVPMDSKANSHVAAVVDQVIEFTLDGRVHSTTSMDRYVEYTEEDAYYANDSWDHYYPGWETHDVLHANSVTYDPSDDSIIVGLHRTGQILKYERKNRRLAWIIGDGGTLTLNGDATWFLATHGPSLTSDGNLLVYDNGTLGLGEAQKKSRAIEYHFVPSNGKSMMGVEQVWEYQNDFFSQFMGNVERLDNGNTLMCNGFRIPSMEDFMLEASITEVTAGENPEIVFDFRMERQSMEFDTTKFLFFRAYRIDTLYGWH